jgi:prepilin-type N-terminal cleavage/methylation domain-containing protein
MVREVRARTWMIFVLALSFVPITGLFTTHKIFFVRDLSFFFWSRHLWLRHTLLSGVAPWWDPYVAGGQSAIADALNQLLMPVTLAIRLLPSEVISFNLWIALPLPLAAIGTFMFLQRRVSRQASALGACVFALSGPSVSMLNTPNLSWSVALMPWVLLTTDHVLASPNPLRGSVPASPKPLGGVGGLAIVFALQALCGEPVTWAATGVLLAAYAIGRIKSGFKTGVAGGEATICSVAGGKAQHFTATPQTVAPLPIRGRDFETSCRVLAALVAGALLAAAQLVPTAMAGMRAHRGMLATPDFWSLHPFALWEMVAPHVFGNYYDAFLADLPWMGALNFGRDPFFYSLYVGPLVLLLASVGVITRFRRNAFWLAVALVFLAAALGGYTPLYPLARKAFPPLMYFRFPVKYIVFTIFACAVLVAEGWAAVVDLPPAFDAAQAREGGSHGRGEGGRIHMLATWIGVAAAIALLGSVALLFMPAMASRAAHALAVDGHLKDPAAGAVFLARVGPPLVVRLFALLLAGCGLLLIASRAFPADDTLASPQPLRGEGRKWQRRASALLFAATCADLAITNSGLSPTTDIARLAPPAWYTESAGPSRLYVGGRVRGFMNTNDPDATPTWQERAAVEGRMALDAELPMAPSGWGVREALSYDLPYLWPAEYEATVRQFEQGSRDERTTFLRRAGVRRCVLPVTEVRQWRVVAEVPGWNMRVFECDPGATRVFIASFVEAARDPEDLTWQRDALFNPALPDDVARLRSMPAMSGRPGPPEPAFARIVQDGATTVIVEASAPLAGTLVLRDSYDPGWTADVDGVPAEIARANGLYRAVALPPGRHVIRFSYRPRDLRTGLMISGMTVLLLVLSRFKGFKGFTGFKGFGFKGFNRFGFRRTRNRNPVNPNPVNPNPVNRNPVNPNPVNPLNPLNPSDGFTLVELMIVLAIVGVLMAVAFTEYRGMQARGNDTSALSSLRSIAAAQWQFALTCGNMKYATTLPALAQPVPSTGQGFLSPDLTQAESFEKSGYIFHMTAKPLDGARPACNGAATAEGYAATADPARPGVTGVHFYGVNADRVLYTDDAQTFTENLPESGAPKHGGEVK